jgi:type IV secretion system protein VirB1
MSGTLTVAAFLAMAPACGVAPTEVPMLAALVATESSFHPYAVNVNEAGRSIGSRRFGSVQEAAAYVDALVAQGVTNIDVGATQINLRAGHLQKRGLPPSAAFDPCTAARIAIEVLAECYSRAPAALPEQDRLDAGLACYNSGRFVANGYAERVRVNFSRQILPALRDRATLATAVAPALPSPPAVPALPPQRPTATVLQPGAGREFVFNR